MRSARGERIFLAGSNGCGKSSLLKMIMEEAAGETLYEKESRPVETGEMKLASGLIISYISQDTSFLQGSIRDFVRSRELERKPLFCSSSPAGSGQTPVWKKSGRTF